jgi:predicted nucleotidyltransferase component of viral defense system
MTKSLEQSIKDKIKTISKDQNKQFGEVWQSVILERFLVRVSLSKYRDQFIFKGGLCLQKYLKVGRSTMDLDFLIRGINANLENLKEIFEEIALIKTEDGFLFSNIKVGTLTHAHMKYPGYEISMRAELGSTRTIVNIDIGVGDIVEPANITIELAANKNGPIFEKEIKIWAYDPETIFAEKLETAIKRDALNSRMKDYHDMIAMIKSGILSEEQLGSVLNKTFTHRKTKMAKIPNFTGEDLSRIEKLWENHLKIVKKNEDTAFLPEKITEVIDVINNFLESVKND